MEHFCFQFSFLEKLWRNVHTIINVSLGHRIVLTWDMALLGIVALNNVSTNKIQRINMIILLAKLSISKSKYGSGIDPALILETEIDKRNFQIPN